MKAKMISAVILFVLGVIVIPHFIINAIMAPTPLESPAYPIAAGSAASGDTGGEAKAGEAAKTEGTETAPAKAEKDTGKDAAKDTADKDDKDKAADKDKNKNGGDVQAVAAAKGDPAKGQALSKKCTACHDFSPEMKTKIGPPLWQIAGAAQARAKGFSYSADLAAAGGKWDDATLDKFLTNPKGLFPGTKMLFAGLSKGEERLDIIAYLHSLTENAKK